MVNTSPIRISEVAKREILETLTANKIPDSYGLRVGMKGGGCAGQFILGFDTASEHDQVYLVDTIRVIIDKRHLMYVIGTEVDFEETDSGAGFTIVK